MTKQPTNIYVRLHVIICPQNVSVTPVIFFMVSLQQEYKRGADKSLARPWNEASYSDEDLRHYTKTYGV